MQEARTLECATRLRQIGIATASYSSTNDGELPLSVHLVAEEQAYMWVFALSNFLGYRDTSNMKYPEPAYTKDTAYQDGFYSCNEQEIHEHYSPPWPTTVYLDYGMNTNINYGSKELTPPSWPGNHHHTIMEQITTPSAKLLFTDGGGLSNVGPGGLLGDGGFTPVPNTEPGRWRFPCPRHLKGGRRKGANICFVDTHVEWLSTEEIPVFNTGIWLPVKGRKY